jgi:hypothetical protein
MARKALRKVPSTVEELEQLSGIRHCWRSKTGQLFYLEPTTRETVEERNGKWVPVTVPTDTHGRKLFQVVLVDWDKTNSDFPCNGEWSIPTLHAAEAVYVGHVMGEE